MHKILIDFDVAIEAAQSKLYAAQKVAEADFEEAKQQVIEMVKGAEQEYDKAVATYNIKLAAARAAEGLAREQLKEAWNEARTKYDDAILDARITYRALLATKEG